MISLKGTAKKTIGFLLLVIHLAGHTSAAGTKFASHVSINTPARSFTHGVGDPISLQSRRHQQRSSFRSLPVATQAGRSGYPRIKPFVPFRNEDVSHDTNLVAPWNYNYVDVAIPVLPPSPYKVDSPDPESLWPEGLFLPPLLGFQRRHEEFSESDPLDPYLVEGSEAIAAVHKASDHGIYYFHDIPHIESLLANQEIRIQNHLKPHRIASIRHTWPYNRP